MRRCRATPKLPVPRSQERSDARARRQRQPRFRHVAHELAHDGKVSSPKNTTSFYRANLQPGSVRASGEHRPADDAGLEPHHHPDPVLLFADSAADFNAPRTFRPRLCARRRGDPGLIVHGPLIATLMADWCTPHAPKRAHDSFSFRAWIGCSIPRRSSCAAVPIRDVAWKAVGQTRARQLAMQAEAKLADLQPNPEPRTTMSMHQNSYGRYPRGVRAF